MAISILAGPKFIAFLRREEYGQHIREEGPAGHHLKQGTPTMGGLLIVLSMVPPFLALSRYTEAGLTVFFVTLGCAAIGFADDLIKVTHRRSLGLAGRWKLLLLVGITALITFAAMNVVTWIRSATSTELRDASALDLAILGAALTGGAIGFLWYNAFPAEIFMGDTGSMAIGGAIGAFAVMTKTELLLLLIGGIFVVEAVSVILQVFSFRYWGRRLFLMTPIHHHFEMKAWSETKIMVRFWILAAIMCAAAFAFYYRYYLDFRALR